MRNVEFVNGEFYHIYNRGVEKRNIFLDVADRQRFASYFSLFNVLNRSNQSLEKKVRCRIVDDRALIKLHSFCLMNNHYHLLVSQTIRNGISKFMHRLSMGYAHYFNKKYERSGSLFESAYKIKHVDSTAYLLQTSAYIHFNPFELTSGDHQDFIYRYPWSSFYKYGHNETQNFLVTDPILSHFQNHDDYKAFVFSRLKEHKDNTPPGGVL